jgi:hypothetical protein
MFGKIVYWREVSGVILAEDLQKYSTHLIRFKDRTIEPSEGCFVEFDVALPSTEKKYAGREDVLLVAHGVRVLAESPIKNDFPPDFRVTLKVEIFNADKNWGFLKLPRNDSGQWNRVFFNHRDVLSAFRNRIQLLRPDHWVYCGLERQFQNRIKAHSVEIFSDEEILEWEQTAYGLETKPLINNLVERVSPPLPKLGEENGEKTPVPRGSSSVLAESTRQLSLLEIMRRQNGHSGS